MGKTVKSILETGIDELGLTVSKELLSAFEIFEKELSKWNSKINLTSITTAEEIAIKHFIDSLAVARFMNPSGKMLDIGSGGGFPSIPLKLYFPDMEIISVDSVGKKINFQKHAARVLNFSNFAAIHSRVEMLSPEYDGFFDCIISRAFSDLEMFSRVSLPLLSDDGLIIAMKGREGKSEAENARGALSQLGLVVEKIEEYRLPILKDDRSIIIIRKNPA